MPPESKRPNEITLFPEPVTATVEETITLNQPGRVRFQSTSWPARLYARDNDRVTLTPKSSVCVVGRQGNIALVVPESDSDETSDENIMFPEAMPGTVEETITPTTAGRVRFQSTSWPAKLYNCDDQVTLTPNEPIDVVARDGITLLVVPTTSKNSVRIPHSEEIEDLKNTETATHSPHASRESNSYFFET